MEFDVAVLGGGPAGYTAAIRAAQLGARVACIDKESELGGTCLRVGCIPTKAWVQTAHALHAAREIDPKLGVVTGEPTLDFSQANDWKAAVVKQMTGGVASLFKANGVTWFQGTGRFEDNRSISFDTGDVGLSFSSAIIATGSSPIRPPIPGLDSPRCVDSTGLLAQTELPRRLVVLGGGIIGCEFASIFERFGTEVTIVEMLDSLIPQEDADATSELRKSFARRGIVVHLGKQCTEVEDSGSALVVHFGEGETVECDLMLVSVGRAPIVAGYWQLAHTAFREGEIAAENATGHEAPMPETAVPRPIYTDPEIAGVGLTEAEARERHGDENIAVGRFPWVANARAVMSGEAAGWVKTIHETTYGELVGVVIVGAHATDLIEAAVVALDAESTIETIADGMAAHPTLGEGVKIAGQVALGRAIDLPPRRK
jgi:dihydrolipoyl dehydrogenase